MRNVPIIRRLVVKLFSLALSLISAAQGLAKDINWDMFVTLEPSSRENPAHDVVTFSSENKKVVYSPLEPPFGIVAWDKIRMSEKTYFLTSWAHGAHTTVFRVFAPELRGARPLCEKISFAEVASLKQENGKLKIRIMQKDSGEDFSWEICGH